MNAHRDFRSAMTWLHSWVGVLIGALLFVIFWFGTMTVMMYPIDRWMMPETRFESSDAELDADAIVERALNLKPQDQIDTIEIIYPNYGVPYAHAHIYYEYSDPVSERIDLRDGSLLDPAQTLGGSGFLYPMHITLHLPGNLGWWIVLLGGLTMLLLLVTGTIAHRKFLVDFFTFRTNRKLRRSSLDLHNLAGAIFLPFHFLIVVSGITVWVGWYASLPWEFLHKTVSNHNPSIEILTNDLFNKGDAYMHYAPFEREISEETAQVAALGPMIEQAEAIWTERYGEIAKATHIGLDHPGNAGGTVVIARETPQNRVELSRDGVFYDAASGTLLYDKVANPVQIVRTWLSGMHFIQFDHWLIRWFYFISGLVSCLTIATGFVFWTASRSDKHSAKRPFKVRFVEAVTIGATTGTIAATAMFLVANRLIPEGADLFGRARASLEVWAFFVIWIASVLHAAIRGAHAWREQCFVIAILGVSAVLLNWFTTGDHLAATIWTGYWPVAGVDLVLLAGAFVAAYAGPSLSRSARHHTHPQNSVGQPIEPAE